MNKFHSKWLENIFPCGLFFQANVKLWCLERILVWCGRIWLEKNSIAPAKASYNLSNMLKSLPALEMRMSRKQDVVMTNRSAYPFRVIYSIWNRQTYMISWLHSAICCSGRWGAGSLASGSLPVVASPHYFGSSHLMKTFVLFVFSWNMDFFYFKTENDIIWFFCLLLKCLKSNLIVWGTQMKDSLWYRNILLSGFSVKVFMVTALLLRFMPK